MIMIEFTASDPSLSFRFSAKLKKEKFSNVICFKAMEDFG